MHNLIKKIYILFIYRDKEKLAFSERWPLKRGSFHIPISSQELVIRQCELLYGKSIVCFNNR